MLAKREFKIVSPSRFPDDDTVYEDPEGHCMFLVARGSSRKWPSVASQFIFDAAHQLKVSEEQIAFELGLIDNVRGM